MENFKKKYRDLEQRVFNSLKNKIEKSDYISKHTGHKALQVNLYDYTELAVINDNLTFMDDYGYQYSLWNGDTNLEDLIDILY